VLHTDGGSPLGNNGWVDVEVGDEVSLYMLALGATK